MKKFILSILFCLISFTAFGQFAQSPTQELKATTEYQEGRRLINNSFIYAGVSIVTAPIGAGLVMAGPTERTIIDAATGSIYNTIDYRPVYIGWSLIGVSTISAVISVYKAVKGSNKIRDAKFDYAVKNGALVITF